jgi:Protein of unknown function (DUF2934)
MPSEFNGNDVPAPEKSTKRKSTPKARKSSAVASDGAAAMPAPAKKTTARKSTPKSVKPEAPEVQVAEAVVSNLSTMPSPSSNNLHERIRARAYEIYVERGGQHGFDQADWLQAEAEIRGKLTA